MSCVGNRTDRTRSKLADSPAHERIYVESSRRPGEPVSVCAFVVARIDPLRWIQEAVESRSSYLAAADDPLGAGLLALRWFLRPCRWATGRLDQNHGNDRARARPIIAARAVSG